MAVIQQTAPIEAEKLDRYFAGVSAGFLSGSFQPAMEGCYAQVKQAHRDNFTSSASPDGSNWAPRKPRKGDDGHPLLIETGALLQAATGGGAGHIGRVSERGMVIGVDPSIVQGGIPAAEAHQSGTANMVARPWLGANEAHLKACDAIVADYGLTFF